MAKHWTHKPWCAFYTRGPQADAFEQAAIQALSKVCVLPVIYMGEPRRTQQTPDVEFVSAVYKFAIPKHMKGLEYVTPYVDGASVSFDENGRVQPAWVPNGASQRAQFVMPDAGYEAVE